MITRIEMTADPTTGDDVNDGYANGCIWVNTSSTDCWVLTDNSAGAAVWSRTDNAATGYALWYGANYDLAGQYARTNGNASTADHATLNEDSYHNVPIDGKLAWIGWHISSSGAGLFFKVVHNGVVTDTVSIGAVTGTAALSGTAVSAGDGVAIEYDAGPAPGNSMLTIFITPTS